MNGAPAEPLTALARTRFSLRDMATATRMYILRSLRETDTLAVSIVMPVIFVLVFSYVFGGSVAVPGGDYEPYLLSGILPQGMLFAAGTVAVAVAADMREGVMDRFRVMPIARPSVLFGRTIATGIAGLPGLAVMTGCAFAMGLRPDRGPAHTLAAFAVMLSFAWAMAWVGAVIGLVVSGPGAANSLSMAPSLLLAFVSNVYVDPAHMPAWLRVAALWNPLSTVVAAVRRLFGVPTAPAPAGVLPLQHPVAASVVLIGLMFAVLVPLSVRLYGRVR
ncbi:ABC transporter permease [Streptomyces sediminimaris]|uniref:ABC transporter permease n=1 Tax=Streptomyces sediminimaris TaxID=3383721 RepID=UPI00399ACA93